MDEDSKLYVGLDVHKDSIAIGVAEAGRNAGRVVGQIPHDLARLLKTLARLGDCDEMHVVYEAGPTGYALQRSLSARGYRCEVIAPSLIPRRPGVRVKTDRRDCLLLAELARAGQLRALWVPDPGDEAMRDLSRAREDALKARLQARQQLRAFLLRHGVRYSGKSAWTKTFHRWLGDLSFEDANRQIAFTEYVLAVQVADQRLQRVSESLVQAVSGWRFAPVVAALRALRGIDVVCAIGLVVEIGDIARFDHPRKLMAYLGLVPCEHSSGDRVRRGAITRSGNSHARRLLTEAAWNYRFKPRITRCSMRRQQDLSAPIQAIAWKAQVRLTGRYARLQARGVQPNKVCVAVARELTGFVWAIAQASSPACSNPVAC